MTIETVFQQAVYLKELFTKVERQPWAGAQYALEMIVQIGHLTDAILQRTHKLKKTGDKNNLAIISDELADILLATFSLAYIYEIPLSDLTKRAFKTQGDQTSWKLEQSPQSTAIEGVLNDLINNSAKIINQLPTEHTRDMGVFSKLLSDEMILCAALANYYEIDLDESFSTMTTEAEIFVSNHSAQ